MERYSWRWDSLVWEGVKDQVVEKGRYFEGLDVVEETASWVFRL
jgi:hypothetical protein